MSEMQFRRCQEKILDLRHERCGEPRIVRMQFMQQRLLQHLQIRQVSNPESLLLGIFKRIAPFYLAKLQWYPLKQKDRHPTLSYGVFPDNPAPPPGDIQVDL